MQTHAVADLATGISPRAVEVSRAVLSPHLVRTQCCSAAAVLGCWAGDASVVDPCVPAGELGLVAGFAVAMCCWPAGGLRRPSRRAVSIVCGCRRQLAATTRASSSVTWRRGIDRRHRPAKPHAAGGPRSPPGPRSCRHRLHRQRPNCGLKRVGSSSNSSLLRHEEVGFVGGGRFGLIRLGCRAGLRVSQPAGHGVRVAILMRLWRRLPGRSRSGLLHLGAPLEAHRHLQRRGRSSSEGRLSSGPIARRCHSLHTRWMFVEASAASSSGTCPHPTTVRIRVGWASPTNRSPVP
jgi:hypothetical protein